MVTNKDEDSLPRHHNWEQELADSQKEFRPALETLVKRGCDRDRIMDLLGMIRATLFPFAERCSRADVRRFRKALLDGAQAIDGMAWTEICHLAPARDWRGVSMASQELKRMASFLEKLEPFIHGRKSILQNQCTALLVYYVKRETGDFYDEEVAAVIEAACHPGADWVPAIEAGEPIPKGPGLNIPWKPYSVANHHRWKERHPNWVSDPPLLEAWEERFRRGSHPKDSWIFPRLGEYEEHVSFPLPWGLGGLKGTMKEMEASAREFYRNLPASSLDPIRHLGLGDHKKRR